MPEQFVHRPLQTDEELQTLHRMMIAMFVGGDALDGFGAFHTAMSRMPDLPADARRGIFAGTTLVSGCVAHARQLRIGRAHIPTACIGAVMTQPEYRGRGLAARLIEEVMAHATARGDGLLLLDGITDFYDRFGYVSVHNWTQFTFQIDEILDGPQAQIRLRPVAAHDVDAMLQRYRRHFGSYTGSFARTPAVQRHHLLHPTPYAAYFVAERTDGTLCGHMRRTHRDVTWSSEITADGPDVAVALLQHHARDVRRYESHADALHWLVAPQSDLADWLGDRYEVIVRTPVQPHGGWMARPADLDVLFAHMIPAWQAEWLAHPTGWHGRLGFCIGRRRYALEIGALGVDMAPALAAEEATATLTPGVFTQLCFGYRSARWAAAQPGVHIPPHLLPVLHALFPRRQTWITGSDFF